MGFPNLLAIALLDKRRVSAHGKHVFQALEKCGQTSVVALGISGWDCFRILFKGQLAISHNVSHKTSSLLIFASNNSLTVSSYLYFRVTLKCWPVYNVRNLYRQEMPLARHNIAHVSSGLLTFLAWLEKVWVDRLTFFILLVLASKFIIYPSTW